MGGYINKISSLEDRASAQVAINLCQGNGFKEVALCLEKPTYGGFVSSYSPSSFISDPEKLSTWAKVKDDPRLCDVFQRSCCLKDTEKAERWDRAVEKQCQRLTEGITLPNRLKQKIHPWITRIALQYLSYSRRQEILFGVSRYFLMDIFTRGDWKEAAQLDEKKLAQRLLEDERLTVLQKYRIACVYCLHVHIPQLWEKLTQEEKQLSRCHIFDGNHGLVFLWSLYMDANQAWTKKDLWISATSHAISYGNNTALMVCWKELQEDIRQKTVIDRALESLQQWQSHGSGYYKSILVSDQLPRKECAARFSKNFNASSYYSESMYFFLSQMNEQKQQTFFKKAFQENEYCKSVLECFLDCPYQDDFLPTINRLWGLIPKDAYRQCLLALASKYSRNEEKANTSYDYRSLLKALWEETPEEYKQHVFCDIKTNYSMTKEGKKLLSQLLKRSPFQEKDETLFKQIFRYQPQEKRREMMLDRWGKTSKEGETMCSLLVQKEKWSFLDWFVEECLSKEKIPIFKKRFIESDCGVKLCLDALKENRERLVEDFLDWSFNSDVEKTQCKNGLINKIDSIYVCEDLLREGKFADVERMINFCLSSDEKKEQFKDFLAQYTCGALLTYYSRNSLLEECVWKQMDTIIAWRVDTEEKRRDFKKELFSRGGTAIYNRLVFIEEIVSGKIERFYQWFELSPEEIKQLKRDTLFTPDFIDSIGDQLLYDYTELVAPLRWCLTDEELVIDFKKAIEKEYFAEYFVDEEEKKQLNDLISELLKGFRKEEIQDKTSREGVLVKGIGEKRSSVGIEDESTSPRKRRKNC